MRIRQIRPEFFTDPTTAHLPPAVQVAYIGLWCIADDAGWLVWDVPQIGALLSPYKSIQAREKSVIRAAFDLANEERLVFYDCGCAWIPKLAEHQKIGGNKSFPVRDRHQVHTRMDKPVSRIVPICEETSGKIKEWREVHTSTDKSARNGRVRNVTVVREAAAPDGATSRLRDGLLAAGMKPEIAGKVAS